MNKLPSWIVPTIGQLGFPIVLSLILLGMLTGWVPGLVTAKSMEQHVQQQEEVIRLLRLICINTGQMGQETVAVCLKGLDRP